MKHIALADSFGIVMLAAVTAMPLGCGIRPSKAKEDLQPFIAVTGNYELLVTGPRPTPAPEPTPAPGRDGCQSGCRCNGTGKEPTGDGLAVVPCRCDDSCRCKQGKQAKCEDGKCPLPTQRIVR